MPAYQVQRKLRAWQREALRRWLSNGCRGIAEVVTGGGKTVFALAAAEAWMRDHQEGAVVVVVPTSALQDQWVISLMADLGVPEQQICVWPDEKNLRKRFHVLVVNSGREAVTRIAAQHRDMLLVADECHRYGSPENRRALTGSTASIGLTATARSEFGTGYDDILVPSLGPTIYTYGIDQAREDGVVSAFRLINVEVELSSHERAAYERLTKRIAIATANDDLDLAKRLSMQRATVSKRAAMRVPVAISLMDGLKYRRALVFHEEISGAEALARGLTARGHSVGQYHTGIGGPLRRDNLRQFRNGWLDVLVCCRALDEGIDVPEAEIALIVASTSTERQRIQRLGRVLRPSAEKDLATVLTIYATDGEQKRLLNEQQRLSDVAEVLWKRAGAHATNPG